MYSFPNFEPICFCFMSGSNCCLLTCIQVSQETGQVVWYSNLFENFPVCCDPHKSVVNEAEVDVFLEFPCFFYDPTDVCNLISQPFLNPACTDFINCWKFSVRVLLKPNLKDFENYLTSMQLECSYMVI